MPGAGVSRGADVFGKRGDASLETFLRCGTMAGGGMFSAKTGGGSFHFGGGALAGAGVASPDEALPEPARSRMSLHGFEE